MLYIWAQIFMTLNVVIYTGCFFTKNKTTIFLLQAISFFFFVLQYVCLGAWAGFLSATAEFVRLILFFFYAKYNTKKVYQIITVVVAYIVTTIFTILTWAAWFSIIPLIGLLFLFITAVNKHVVVVKVGMLITVTCSFLYLMMLSSYYSAALEMLNIIVGITLLIKDLIDIKRNKIAN